MKLSFNVQELQLFLKNLEVGQGAGDGCWAGMAGKIEKNPS